MMHTARNHGATTRDNEGAKRALVKRTLASAVLRVSLMDRYEHESTGTKH